MSHPKGKTLPLSLPRRFIGDLVHFGKQVPTVPVQRRMHLGAVAAARRAAHPRPAWATIFTKAYAFVCARRPELRRAYLSFPRARLYEHPFSIASIAIERQFGDEEAVFFTHARGPENQSLPDLDAHLRRCKEAPIESIGIFRRILQVSRLPRPLRRLMWWYGLSVSGARRAKMLGTFGVSVVAGLGAASLHPISPLTTTLNYGVMDEDGTIDVRLMYDHRVMDGANVARALDELEQVLKSEILTELRYLQAVDAA